MSDHTKHDTGKQTALFFGFLTAAMTYASAQGQAAPQVPGPETVRPAATMETQTPATTRDAKRIKTHRAD